MIPRGALIGALVLLAVAGTSSQALAETRRLPQEPHTHEAGQEHAHSHPMEEPEGARGIVVFGRSHPLIIHFPIALLVLSGVVELWRMARRRPAYVDGVPLLVRVAAVFAVVAAASGLIWSREHDASDALLMQHRNFGVITAGVSLAVLVAGELARRRPLNGPLALTFRLGLFAATLLVAATAHMGGRMVFGEGFPWGE